MEACVEFMLQPQQSSLPHAGGNGDQNKFATCCAYVSRAVWSKKQNVPWFQQSEHTIGRFLLIYIKGIKSSGQSFRLDRIFVTFTMTIHDPIENDWIDHD